MAFWHLPVSFRSPVDWYGSLGSCSHIINIFFKLMALWSTLLDLTERNANQIIPRRTSICQSVAEV